MAQIHSTAVSNRCIIISMHLWLRVFEVCRGTSTGQQVTSKCVQACEVLSSMHRWLDGSAWNHHTFCGSASITWKTQKHVKTIDRFPDATVSLNFFSSSTLLTTQTFSSSPSESKLRPHAPRRLAIHPATTPCVLSRAEL